MLINLINYFVIATANPFIPVFNSMKDDIVKWLMIIIGILVVIFSLKDVAKYIQGEEDEKAAAGKAIKYKIYVLIGAYILIWFISYLITKFSAVNVASTQILQLFV